ncbi:MAG TPA: tail fiber protein [Chitinophagaceae bacterium]|nr:tail fiber protein [Chitinophagaceae bacterium]
MKNLFLLIFLTATSFFAHAQNVGIGTPTPEFKLSLDNDGGIIAKGTVNSGATLITSGAGTRMLWYPNKAAFRAGYVNGTQWDDATIGSYSFASGYNTTASGGFSTAIGFNATASVSQSIAIGYFATASGSASTAMGYSVSTNAKTGSFAVGDASTNTIMNSSTENQFSARFAGGYRLFSDAATTDANGMFLTAGNVGIGTTTPQAKLDVNGSIKVNSLTIATGGAVFDFLIKNDATGLVSFRKGNVGIGINYIIALQGSYPSPNPPFVDGTYIGEIKLFSGYNPPFGWALCDGQLLTVNSNILLFALIGTTYGGDGVNNFRLPDLRDAVPVHPGTNWQLGERSN